MAKKKAKLRGTVGDVLRLRERERIERKHLEDVAHFLGKPLEKWGGKEWERGARMLARGLEIASEVMLRHIGKHEVAAAEKDLRAALREQRKTQTQAGRDAAAAARKRAATIEDQKIQNYFKADPNRVNLSNKAICRALKPTMAYTSDKYLSDMIGRIKKQIKSV